MDVINTIDIIDVMNVTDVSCTFKLSICGVMQDTTGQRASSTDSNKISF